ncbi:hypothetical protein LM13656_10188 [Listeria monocytogenes]|nr:hypothetical protein LM13656_10188 [Listeria monocytogenes]CUL00068.1 hypothetical protein LM700876_270178 [Listeria monocytogenes]CUL17369.1 hypothetical protein LM700948_10230 [Listeria monocytogenes]CUL94177.1 hypothetical protein LM900372_10352 [Listeria monocytogenes]
MFARFYFRFPREENHESIVSPSKKIQATSDTIYTVCSSHGYLTTMATKVTSASPRRHHER